MQIIGVILGVLLIAGGVYCIMTPVVTFASLGWIIGAVMIMEGVGSLLTWNSRRLLGIADGWSLAGAILSVVLGGFVVCSGALQFAIDALLAYLVAFWLIVGGVTRIVAAFSLRNAHKAGAEIGANWGLLLLVGILVVLGGVFCLFHPILTMASTGMLIGLGIISSGISLIAGSLAS